MLLSDLYNWISGVWPVLALIGQGLAFVALLWLKTSFVLRVTFESHVAAITARLSGVERRLDQVPASDDVAKLNLLLCEVRGKLDSQQAQMTATNDNLRRMETQINLLTQHLLTGGQ